MAPVGPERTIRALAQGDVIQLASGLVLLGLQAQGGAETPVLLALKGNRLAIVEEHLIDLIPLESGEHVILIGMHELIGGRLDVVARREGERALGELARQVLLLIERVDDIAFIIHLLTTPPSGHVATEEEVGIEISRALGGEARTQTIDEVGGDDGVDRADIDLRGVLLGARLDEVLDESLQTEDDILKALDILDVLDEIIHGALALGEFHLAILRPEVVAAHHGVGILHLLLLALEELTWQFVEGIVGHTRVADHGEGIEEAGELEFREEIIDGEHPLAIGQLRKLLHNLHVLHEVHIALLGDGHLAALPLP